MAIGPKRERKKRTDIFLYFFRNLARAYYARVCENIVVKKKKIKIKKKLYHMVRVLLQFSCFMRLAWLEKKKNYTV